jgi:hypothetical protein
MMALTTQSNRRRQRSERHPQRLTFEALHRSTAGLSGPSRAQVFYNLPREVQAAAWRDLAEQVERDRELEMAS